MTIAKSVEPLGSKKYFVKSVVIVGRDKKRILINNAIKGV